MRDRLWPDHSEAEHRAEMEQFLADPDRYGQFIALTEDGQPTGFAEVSLRHDYVNGTSSSPVAFLEGIFVDEAARRTGVARSLVNAVIACARARGVIELASDAELSNSRSHAMHIALGFEETEQVVCFTRSLSGGQDT
ncbi:MAG: GNAT family N-acetyltransferase [Calditrichaeota bacterium]|nr:GNAT family N-acetyltransferase [Calditrichota bacterium]